MMNRVCPRCGKAMEAGFTSAKGLYRSGGPPKLSFVVPGSRPSLNPIEAFRQGMAGDIDRWYRIEGFRCSGCGLLELYADPPSST